MFLILTADRYCYFDYVGSASCVLHTLNPFLMDPSRISYSEIQYYTINELNKVQMNSIIKSESSLKNRELNQISKHDVNYFIIIIFKTVNTSIYFYDNLSMNERIL